MYGKRLKGHVDGMNEDSWPKGITNRHAGQRVSDQGTMERF
jgi:hypothetical protein